VETAEVLAVKPPAAMPPPEVFVVKAGDVAVPLAPPLITLGRAGEALMNPG
jgi:hypothetical protein